MKLFMAGFLGFVLGVFTILLLLLADQGEPNVMASPQRDGTVNITKHDFILLQQFLVAQNKLIAQHQAESDYWQDRYATVEECVREKLKAGKLVMVCFNDKEI